MKTVIYLIAFMLFIPIMAQNKFSTQEWQDDLRFFQKTVHADYPFLFKKTTADEFDKAVEKLNIEIPKMQDYEVMVGFARIVALFKYGHTRLGFRESPVPYHKLPLVLYEYSDGVHIQGTHKDYEAVLGAKLIAIEGVPIEKALKAIYPVVPSENDQFFKAYAGLYMVIPEVLHAQGITSELKTTIQLTLEKNGKTFQADINASKEEQAPMRYNMIKPGEDWLEARDQNKTPLYLKNLDDIYYYEYLQEEKTVYIRQSQIQDDPKEDIPTFYKKVFDFVENNEVDKLILDVRLNGGGNNYKNKPVVTGIIEAEKINKPGKLFVIIGRRTFSACQNLVNELDNYTNATFVGEPTSENINFYGDNRRVELPNTKMPLYLSFAWWQDKPQWENGPWTAPHLAVDISFEEYKSNKDPVLQAALSFSDNDFILDPMAHLTKLFMANKPEELMSEAKRMVLDPKYSFFDFESEFNKAGYNLLGNNNEGALFVFEMNTNLFPDSANAWDSLAEGYLKTNNKEKAIEYYTKALKMDPNGKTGENAKTMLKKIKSL